MYNPKDYFTDDEIKQIRLFGISIKNNIIPLQYKDSYWTSSGRLWDIDTYTHGVCKCLTMTEWDFKEYYQSVRHEDNTMCSNLDLFFKICYEYKIKSFLELKKLEMDYQHVFVVEAGRGIDVLLAILARGSTGWQRISAYDQDKSVLFEMNKYFAGELKKPFYPLQINTHNYDFSSINERTVIFGTCHNLTEEMKNKIKENKNLIGILDGELLS